MYGVAARIDVSHCSQDCEGAAGARIKRNKSSLPKGDGSEVQLGDEHGRQWTREECELMNGKFSSA